MPLLTIHVCICNSNSASTFTSMDINIINEYRCHFRVTNEKPKLPVTLRCYKEHQNSLTESLTILATV